MSPNANPADPRPEARRKAVALISGGLDSMLAARTVLDQGVHVEGINFFTGFCVEGHTHAIRRRANGRGANPRNNALWVAEQLGIRLHLIDVVEDYKRVVLNPKHGYGANLNPCLDCKTFMVGRAREWMEERGFDFIVTGESGDFLGRDRELDLEEGDLVAVLSAGAYGFVMSSNYNSRPRAAEVMVDGERAHLVRRREEAACLYALESRLPPSPR